MSSNLHSFLNDSKYKVGDDQRNLYFNEVKNRSAESLLHMIRKFTGFDKKEIASFFGNPKITTFAWEYENRMSVVIEKHIKKFMELMVYIDRGSADLNRILLQQECDGKTLLSWLNDKEYDLVRNYAGKGSGRSYFGGKPTEDAKRYNLPRHFGLSVLDEIQSS